MLNVVGQDAQFSQFYAAPLYLNPAFTGTTIKTRGVMNYRNQWASLPGSFVTYSVSADFNAEEYNSGFGILLTTDKAGSANMKTTDVGALYGYKLQLSKELVLRTGMQFSYVRRSINYADLVFGSQLNANTGHTGSSSGENLDGSPSKSYFDFSSGLLLHDKRFWFGFSAHHINQPNQAFNFGESKTLPSKYSVHGGAKLKVVRNEYSNDRHEFTLTPAFLYKFQDTFDQLDLGMYINYNPVVFGLWYRGLPVKRYKKGFSNHDAIAFLVGFHQDYFTIGYSYDLTVSRLGASTGGSHEISLSYELDWPVNKKRRLYEKYIPCPKF